LSRSQVIERILKHQIDDEEKFVRDMESPVMRTILSTLINTPGLLQSMAVMLGENLPDEDLKRIREGAVEQKSHDIERQQLKKASKKNASKKEDQE
jgi:hypothetical protein